MLERVKNIIYNLATIKIFRAAIIILILIGNAITVKSQTTVTLNPVADNDIYVPASTTNYGTCNLLYINGGSYKDRSLLRFDLSSIPTSANITEATLTLVMNSGSSTSADIGVYLVTNSWAEGTGSCSGTSTVSNWNQRTSGTNWTTAGGDFNASPEATASVAGSGSYDWNILAAAQFWYNSPDDNYGVIMKYVTETSSNQKTFHSREATYSTNWPKLVITYTVASSIGPGGVSGVSVWLKADTGTSTTTNGSGIATWTNQTGGGNGTQATAGNQPTYQTGTTDMINFNPVVRFNEANSQYFDLSANVFGDGTARTSVNMFVLSKNSTLSTKGSIWVEQDGSGNRVNQHLTWSNGLIYWDAGSTQSSERMSVDLTTSGINTTDPFIWSFLAQSTAQSIKRDGYTVATNGSANISYSFTNLADNRSIGRGTGTPSEFYGGNIGEIIGYSTSLTSTQTQQIESYLAIKYGKTLDQTSAQNYLASDGTTVYWNGTTNSGYNNNIACIARDDNSALIQKQSKSVNTGLQVVVGNGNTIATDNVSNTQNFSADQSALVWGDNAGSVDEWTTSGSPASRKIVARIWKVQETGTVGSVKVQVADNSGTNGLPEENNTVYLLVDADGNFVSGATEITMTLNGANWEGNVDFTNGQFFTFVTDECTPAIGTLVFALGATSSRCQGAATVTYTATSTNSTGMSYSLDATSLSAGNTINTSTGQVTYIAGWSGTSVITASATGCSGPKTADHTVTINPLPSGIAVISGLQTVSQGQAGVSYSVAGITNATSYIWNYSGDGVTINVSGASITIDFASYATSGNLTVRGINSCGNGDVSSNYPITVNSLVLISGDQNIVCPNQIITYGLTHSFDSYQWTVTGGTPSSGTSSTIDVTWGTGNRGQITVEGFNGGISIGTDTRRIYIDQKSLYTASEDTALCAGGTATLDLNFENKSLFFDGNGDYVGISNSDLINLGTTDYRTVLLWFKAVDVNNRQVLYNEGGAVNGFSIYIEGGKVYVLAWESNTAWNAPNTTINTGQWYNIAFVFDQDATDGYHFKGYLNGVSIGEYNEGSKADNGLNAHSGPVAIGSNSNIRFHDNSTSSNNYFNGYIDGFKLWNRSLPQSEIILEKDHWLSNPVIDAALDVYIDFNNSVLDIADIPSAESGLLYGNPVYNDDAPLLPDILWSPGGSTSRSISVSPGVTTTYNYTLTEKLSEICSQNGFINVTVTPVPTVTGTTPGYRCGPGTVTLGATASSGVVNWYESETGGVSIGTGTSFTTPSISSTTTYWVDATNNGCTTTTRTSVTATVNTSNPVEVVSTLGTVQNCYATLKTAFDAINIGTHRGVIYINIVGNTTETATAVLNSSGSGSSNYSSITIQPVGGEARTISGTLATPLIDFYGASNVIIDGLNTGGNSLTISNFSISTAASTLRFIQDAKSNIVRNCTIEGSSTSATIGTLFFSTGLPTTGSGNDGNTITNNTIKSAGSNLPINAIYSLGTSAVIDNSGNIISNNTIQDFFSPTLASNGIWVAGFNSGWNITNNKFFQSDTRTVTGGTSIVHRIIQVTSGNGYLISGNIIGFNNSGGTGTMTYTRSGGTTTPLFRAIELNVGYADTSNVQGNIITAISFSTNSGTATAPGIFTGISVLSGNVNIGTGTGNTIGAETGNGSISVTSTVTSGYISGIYSTSTGTVRIQNNIIGSISTGGTYSIGYTFRGINTAGTLGNYSISSNTIGSLTTTNSIAIGTDGLTTSGVCTFYGINSSATGNQSITGNIVQNCTVYGTGASVFYGIYNTGGTGALDIITNSIRLGTNEGTGALTVITNTAAAATVNINNNIIRSFTRSLATGTFTGILSSGAITSVLNINNNQFGNSNGGLIAYEIANASALIGITVTAATNTCALTIMGNDFRGIEYTNTGSGAHTYIINAATTLSQNISNNTFTNLDLNKTGAVTFISNSVIIPPNGFQIVSGNGIVTGFNKSGASGNITLFTSTALTVGSGITVTHQNNNFSNITLKGTSAITGWVHTDAGQSAKTFTGNKFDNWATEAGAIIGLSVSGFGGNSTVSNDTITNLNGQLAITGLTIGSSGVASELNLNNNTITNLNSTGTGGVVTGLSSTNPSTNVNISYNTINNLSSTVVGSSSSVRLVGITVTANTTMNITNNVIHSLSVSGTTTPVFNGITVVSTGTVTIQGNSIHTINTAGLATSAYTFNGIAASGAAGNFTITGNTIGSASPSSIVIGTNGVTTAVCTFVGISCSATGINSVTDNIIQNSITYGTGASTIQAINCSGTPVGVGIGSTLNITGNNILSHSNYGTGILRGISSATGITANQLGTVNINNNKIRSHKIYSVSGTFTGIASTGIASVAININNNELGNTEGGLVNYENANSGILTGISASGTSTNCAVSIKNNDIRGITYSTACTHAHSYITNTSIAASHDVSENTFTNLNVNTTGSVTFITNSAAMPVNGIQTVKNNQIVTGFNKGGAGGTITGITSTAATANSGVTVSVENNNLSNITVTGGTAINGIVNTDAGAGVPQKTIKNNTLENWTGGTGVIQGMSLNGTGAGGEVTQNLIRNISNGSTITGIVTGAGNDNIFSNQVYSLNAITTAATIVTGISVTAASTKNIYLNTIYNLSAGTGITTGSVRGIAISGGTTVNVYQNTIHGLTGSSLTTVTTGSINGIAISGGGSINLSRNKIYDLSTSSPSLTGTINGIVITGTTASLITTISNNIIGSLNVTAGSGADLVRGISLANTGASSHSYVYYNTVYLNASSGGTNFGSSGIYHTATTTVLELRNNIIINNSTPKGTGWTVAFRRSAATLATYSSSSNNNLYYSGTSGSTRLIYYDGTNSDQTLSAFQARVSPREDLSVTEDMLTDLKFLSVNGADGTFLHIDPTKYTLVEGQGVSIGITTDFDGDTRSGTPDIGADEFVSCALFISSISAIENPICWNSFTTLTANGITGTNAVVTWWTGAGGTGTNLGTGLTLVASPGLYYARVTNGCGVPAERDLVLTISSAGEWTGNINTEWANTDNWCSRVLPNSSTDVIINSTAPNMPLINSDAVCNNLTINTGALLATSALGTLGVAGTLINNAGSSGFILQSNATGTASLIHNTDDVPATVERYINGVSEAWHFLSAPVSNQSISGTWLPSGTYGNGTGYDLYLWNEPTDCWIYKLDYTSTVNWNTVHPGSVFMPGRGYLYSVQALNPTKIFTGNLNNGVINYPISFSGIDVNLKGFNLVGNPYPSSIDWQAATGWSRLNLVSSGGGYDMWIWNPSANNYGVYNSFSGNGTNDVTRYIAPMQGFFVRAASAGNLSMDNPVRVNNGSGGWKNAKMNSGIFRLVVKSESDNSFDESLILFGYTANQPGTAKLFSPVETAPSIFLPSEGNYCSVRYLTDTIDNPMVAVMFKAGVNGNYTLDFNFDDNKFETIKLEDRQTRIIQDLKEEKTYSFSALTKDDKNRFLLYFGSVDINLNDELPAKIFTDGKLLIVDLALISEETKINVYDVWGRKLFEQQLQGSTQYNLNLKAVAQVLVIRLLNTNGSLSRKVVWSNR